MIRAAVGVAAGASRVDAPSPVTHLEVVAFRVGGHSFVVPRADVLAIRPSVRVKMDMTGALRFRDIPVVSLSAILGLERDTSVDRRVLETEYLGSRLGLEVTAIAGVRTIPAAALRPLPPVVAANCASRHVLGLVATDGLRGVVLDLVGLLVERRVDVPQA